MKSDREVLEYAVHELRNALLPALHRAKRRRALHEASTEDVEAILRGLEVARRIADHLRAPQPPEWTTPRADEGGRVRFYVVDDPQDLEGEAAETGLAVGSIWIDRGVCMLEWDGYTLAQTDEELERGFPRGVHLSLAAFRAGVTVPIAAVVAEARRAGEARS